MIGAIASIKEWWQGLDMQKWLGDTDALTVAVCFVIFFAVGFLFKKYLKFIFLCLIISALAIKGLEYYKVLTIDWEALNALLGLAPGTTIGLLASNALGWVKLHVVVTISSLIGFLLGYKLG